METTQEKGITWRNGGRINAVLLETIKILDSVAILKIIADSIDEGEIIKIFQNISNLYNLKNSPMAKSREINLYQALHHYENAMNGGDFLFVYRDLFTSLQRIVDVGRIGLECAAMDNECRTLTNTQLNDVYDMRHFFNRIKHIQENSTQTQEFQKGIQTYREWIPMVRKHVKQLLRAELL